MAKKPKNVVEVDENLDEEVPATEDKVPHARDHEVFYLTGKATRAGTVYGQLQEALERNPGIRRDDLRALLQKTLATKKAAPTAAYVDGYITGSIRRGYATHEKDKAVAKVVYIERGSAVSDKKAPGQLTNSGRAVIEAMQSLLEENGRPTSTPISIETLIAKMGRTIATLTRTIGKLEADGYVEVTRSEENKIEKVVLLRGADPVPAEEVEEEAA